MIEWSGEYILILTILAFLVYDGQAGSLPRE